MSTILEGNNYVTKEELKRIVNGGMTSVWHNPTDDIIYGGERTSIKNGKSTVLPTYETPIFNMGKYKQALSLKDAGRLSAEEASLQPWMGEFEALAQERYAVKEAGVIVNNQFTAIDTTTVLAELLNQKIRGFSIPEAVTNVSTDGLEMQIDVYTRFNVSLDVPEGVPAWAKRGSVATTSFDLTKDVGHFAATDEARLKSRKDLYQASLLNVATDFRRAKAAKIADVLETATETNVGDWDAFTSGLSDANPLGHINLRLDAILANNGNVDTIVSHNIGWSAFTGNTFVRGAYNAQKEGIDAAARVVSISLIPGVQWHIDNELLSTSVIVMAKEAVHCVNGPTRVGQYRTEAEGIDGYVARNWYQCQITQTGKIAELVTVTT